MPETDAVNDLPRRPRAARTIVLASVLALSGCSGIGEYLRGDDDEPKPAELRSFESTLEVETLWRTRATSGEGSQRLALRPAVAGRHVVVAGHSGDVSAYDRTNGTRLWNVDTDISISGGPGAGSGLVVVGSDAGEVVALAGADGALAWRTSVSSEVLSPAAIGQRVVVVRTGDGNLFGLDATSGERLWVHDRTVPVLTLRGTSAPVIAGDVVVAGFDSGHLVAISLADGALRWESQAATPTGRTELERLVDIDADPIVSDGIVYVTTYQGNVAAFDLSTGRPVWRRDMSSNAGLGIGERLLYVTDADSHVWALERGSGTSPWRQDGLARRDVTRPVGVGEYVVVADYEGYIHWLSIDDGRFAARVRADGGAVHAPPAASDATVFVLSERGDLTAFTHR